MRNIYLTWWSLLLCLFRTKIFRTITINMELPLECCDTNATNDYGWRSKPFRFKLSWNKKRRFSASKVSVNKVREWEFIILLKLQSFLSFFILKFRHSSNLYEDSLVKLNVSTSPLTPPLNNNLEPENFRKA